MQEKKCIRLEEYLDDYKFSQTSRIRKDGDRIWVPDVYCHNGHSLMVHGVLFDGLPAIHIRCHVGGEGGPAEDFYLSPIIGDDRKKGPDLPAGTRVMMTCPICKEPLRKLVPCSCRVGAYRYAIYLTPDPEELGAIGLCETYGCPQSFVSEDGELIYECVAE
ncbi:MAG: hypothetical protein JXR96_16230 [Deltaproteobacteria bacterium]|nr:hypothetical protein [Deltaproteobacteria bacterium]